MKKLIVLCLTLLVISSICFAESSIIQTSPQYKEQSLLGLEESSSLKLSIESDKQVYETGEPVNIELKLSNVGGKPVSLEVYECRGEPYVTFDIFDSQGNRITYLKELPEHIPIQTKIKLWPGTFYGITINLRESYAIERPDTYTIKLKWVLHNLELIFDTITIKVVEKEPFSISYFFSAEATYRKIEIDKLKLKYTYFKDVEGRCDKWVRSEPCWKWDDLRTRVATLSENEINDLLNLIEELDFMNLETTYGGAGKNQRYYAHKISVKIGEDEKRVFYQSFPGASPMPDAFKKVKNKLFKLVGEKFSYD